MRHLIFLLILSFFFTGMGSRINLCLMPDGEIHMEPNHFSCGVAENHSQKEQVADQNHCLDVSLQGVTSHHHQRSRSISQLPLIAMVPLGPPTVITQTHQKFPRSTPVVALPQLQSLQSVILLI